MDFNLSRNFNNRFNRTQRIILQPPTNKTPKTPCTPDIPTLPKDKNPEDNQIVRNPLLTDFLNDNDKPIVIKFETESFRNVLKEMRNNVPSRTSTIEEKELAISYIDRMLACDDITPEAKEYWSNAKDILNAEIQTIKNNKLTGTGEKWEDVLDELNEFINNFRSNAPKNFSNVSDRVEYWITYNNTCISFYQRMMECNGITNEQKNYCEKQIQLHKRDKNYHIRDLNRVKNEQGEKTESFRSVLEEMRDNIPSRTSTIEEKELAISYIDRMLACDDITPELKAYWNRNKRIIQSEINRMK